MNLDTQAAVRQVRRLPFCYLCGLTLEGACNIDHVPPSTIFLREDRNFPLVLPTHVKCNGDRSGEDESIGQLIGILHGERRARFHKLDVSLARMADGDHQVILRNLDLRQIIRRWVCGFHAALYREYLPGDRGLFMTTPPLPEAMALGERFRPPEDVIAEFGRIIGRNRATRTLDRITCRNGRCRYECVWAQADGGQWACVYALDLYDWTRLGAADTFGPRECLGMYQRPRGGVPRGAATTTNLVFDA